jgi:hypothetical protein
MHVRPIYLTGRHSFSFRRGETSLVVGACMATPEGQHEERMCFIVMFDDGTVDYVPLSEVLKNDPAWEVEP